MEEETERERVMRGRLGRFVQEKEKDEREVNKSDGERRGEKSGKRSDNTSQNQERRRTDGAGVMPNSETFRQTLMTLSSLGPWQKTT